MADESTNSEITGPGVEILTPADRNFLSPEASVVKKVSPPQTATKPDVKPASSKRAKRKKVDSIKKHKSNRDLVQEAKDLIDDNIAQMKAVSKQLGKLTK